MVVLFYSRQQNNFWNRKHNYGNGLKNPHRFSIHFRLSIIIHCKRRDTSSWQKPLKRTITYHILMPLPNSLPKVFCIKLHIPLSMSTKWISLMVVLLWNLWLNSVTAFWYCWVHISFGTPNIPIKQNETKIIVLIASFCIMSGNKA